MSASAGPNERRTPDLPFTKKSITFYGENDKFQYLCKTDAACFEVNKLEVFTLHRKN